MLDFGSDLAALPAEILTEKVRPADTRTLLRGHPHRSGLESLLVARRRCAFSFFTYHSFVLLSVIPIIFLSGNSGIGA